MELLSLSFPPEKRERVPGVRTWNSCDDVRFFSN
jgi:hypothetical protein